MGDEYTLVKVLWEKKQTREILKEMNSNITFGFTILPPWYRSKLAYVVYISFLLLCSLLNRSLFFCALYGCFSAQKEKAYGFVH